MTGKELLEGLKLTGTGDNKLAVIERFLAGKPGAHASEVLDHLRRNLGVINEVTLQKAEHLASGRPLTDLLGKPPKNLQEERDKKLVEGITEKMVDAFKTKAPDAPVKPGAKRPGRPRKEVIQAGGSATATAEPETDADTGDGSDETE